MYIQDFQKDISDRVCNPLPWSNGNTLRRILPNHFEAYCKILHPFTENLDIEDTSFENNKAIEAIEIDVKRRFINRFKLHDFEWKNLGYDDFFKNFEAFLLKKHNIVTLSSEFPINSFSEEIKNDLSFYHNWSNKRKYKIDELKWKLEDRVDFFSLQNSRKLTWQGLAERYGLIFHNNINPTSYSSKLKLIGYPKNLYYPLPYLDEVETKEFINILQKFTPSLEVFYTQLEFKDEIYECNFKISPIDDILIDDNIKHLRKDYIFSENGNWVIWSDVHEDLQLTLVAGSKDLIESLKKESNLEIQECTLDTRVDYYSDYLNIFTPSVF